MARVSTHSQGSHDLPVHLVGDVRPVVFPGLHAERGPAVEIPLDEAGDAEPPDGDRVDDDVALDNGVQKVGDVVLHDAGAAALVAASAILAGAEALLGENYLGDLNLDVGGGGLDEAVAVGGKKLVGIAANVGTAVDCEDLDNCGHFFNYAYRWC